MAFYVQYILNGQFVAQ